MRQEFEMMKYYVIIMRQKVETEIHNFWNLMTLTRNFFIMVHYLYIYLKASAKKKVFQKVV